MSVCTDDACRLSHCSACDAHPGESSHGGSRYLHPIVYEPIAAGGWRVPEHERARWDAPLLRPIDSSPVDEETPSYEALLEQLEPWAPSFALRARLAVAYELDARRVSRLTTAILNTPGVRNPCAVLNVRLVELEHRET